MPADDSTEPISAVAALIAAHRPDSRRLRQLVGMLAERPMDLATLIRQSALPRKTVEAVLSAAGDDLVRDGEAVGIASAQVTSYRQRFAYDRLVATEPADPLAHRMAAAAPTVAAMAKLIAGAPKARSDLDHVQATPETAVRRALWLDSTYDLDGSVLLCVGDHDLTSLAVGQISPGASIVVVDVDEATLEYIDATAARLGLDIRCFVSDFRFWLAESAAGCADLVFTDPPYTPEGLALFVARGLQGLANRDHGRVIVAYGYSDRHPSLGWQAQSAVHRLGLACEAQWPAFSRYDGAQAVGSASDLYVWRPTSRSWRLLDGILADAQANIYTRGGQSVEGAAREEPATWNTVPPAVHRAATEAGFPLTVLVGDSWAGQPGPARESGGATVAQPAKLRLSTLISAGLPPGLTGRDRFAVAADLRADPGAWLLRVLLAVNAGQVAAVVPSRHPDVRDEAGQRALSTLLGAKYTLRFLRSQPDHDHTIVAATAAAGQTLDPGRRVASWLLQRAHGKTGNVWREGLIEAVGDEQGARLTRRDARAIVEAAARRPAILGARLIDVPRHQIAELLDDAHASTRAAAATASPAPRPAGG